MLALIGAFLGVGLLVAAYIVNVTNDYRTTIQEAILIFAGIVLFVVSISIYNDRDKKRRRRIH